MQSDGLLKAARSSPSWHSTGCKCHVIAAGGNSLCGSLEAALALCVSVTCPKDLPAQHTTEVAQGEGSRWCRPSLGVNLHQVRGCSSACRLVALVPKQLRLQPQRSTLSQTENQCVPEEPAANISTCKCEVAMHLRLCLPLLTHL